MCPRHQASDSPKTQRNWFQGTVSVFVPEDKIVNEMIYLKKSKGRSLQVKAKS